MSQRSRMAGRATALIGITASIAALFLAAPIASALATTRYVDDSGNNANTPCTNPSDPCQTIVTALGVAVSGDVVQVGGSASPYAGNLTLPNGVSLVKADFNPPATTGTATINTLGNVNPAVTVTAGTAARTVSGFTLRGGATGGFGALLVNSSDNVTISGNTFDDHSAAV